MACFGEAWQTQTATWNEHCEHWSIFATGNPDEVGSWLMLSRRHGTGSDTLALCHGAFLTRWLAQAQAAEAQARVEAAQAAEEAEPSDPATAKRHRQIPSGFASAGQHLSGSSSAFRLSCEVPPVPWPRGVRQSLTAPIQELSWAPRRSCQGPELVSHECGALWGFVGGGGLARLGGGGEGCGALGEFLLFAAAAAIVALPASWSCSSSWLWLVVVVLVVVVAVIVAAVSLTGSLQVGHEVRPASFGERACNHSS